MSSDVATGAASGAMTGFAVAGPVGAVIGGLFGALGGKKSSQAKKAQRKANQFEQRMAYRAAAVERRNLIREGRMERARSIAASAAEGGGLDSSTGQGALGSIGSQLSFGLNYFDAQSADNREFNKYSSKATKWADQAAGINNIINTAATAYGASGMGPSSGWVGKANDKIRSFRTPSATIQASPRISQASIGGR